jgi:hypothetical protein
MKIKVEFQESIKLLTKKLVWLKTAKLVTVLAPNLFNDSVSFEEFD